MKQPVFIYGAGGLGLEVLSFLGESGLWEPAGFLDDGISTRIEIKGVPVIGGMGVVPGLPKPANIVLAIGDPVLKRKIKEQLKHLNGLLFPTLVHSRAILQGKDSIRVGEGTIITAGCVMTTDIDIGAHVLVNLNCTIGHNTIIGDYSSIMPGVNLAGQVAIGSSVLIGSGANVLNGIKIGAGAKVGAGAVVTKDVLQNVVVVGIPASVRRQ